MQNLSAEICDGQNTGGTFMRNPWPIFSIAAFAGAVCLIYDYFFSYKTMWIAVVASLALLFLWLIRRRREDAK